MRPAPNLIAVLQLGRAVAALAVVAHHAARSTSDFVGPLPAALQAVLDRGYLGVDFFFVLSGFIIYHVNYGKVPTRGWAGKYVSSRFVRIFVPYWPVGIAVALGYTLLPGLSAGSREWSWLATLTLLPTEREPALIVAWTLQNELVFYALFAVFALTGRSLVAAACWVVAIAAWHLLAGEAPARPLWVLLVSINAEFVMGMLAARAIATRSGPASPLLLAASALFLALFVGLGAHEPYRLLFAAGVVGALIAAIRAEAAGRVRVPAVAVLLGNASYAIYLVHNPLIAVLARAAPPHWAAALGWFIVASTAAGLAYHLWYERPAIRLVRSLLHRSRLEPAPNVAIDEPVPTRPT